jgi:hypothetical protein
MNIYEKEIYDKLITKPNNVWLRIDQRKDCQKLTKVIKDFIEQGEPFEFDDTFTKIRKIASINHNTYKYKSA